MDEVEDRLLRKTYSEIINGFSVHRYGKKDIYIKHFSSLDNLEVDYLYAQYYDEAVKRGFPTEKERIELLKRDGLWAEDKDLQIYNLKLSISSVSTMKRKAYLRRDMDYANDQIEEQTALLNKVMSDKEQIIGQTAEKWARQKVDSFFISRSFYKQRDLKDLLFTQEEFDDLDKYQLEELYDVFYSASGMLGEKNIKKIAVKDFFLNVYSLAHTLYEFYGRPISTLTFYQIQLSAYGNFYKNVLSNDPRPPEEIMGDPEKLEDWHYGRANAEEALKRVDKDGQGGSLVGLTTSDRKFLGFDNPEDVPQSSMRERIAKAGGELSMAEIMKIEGV